MRSTVILVKPAGFLGSRFLLFIGSLGAVVLLRFGVLDGASFCGRRCWLCQKTQITKRERGDEMSSKALEVHNLADEMKRRAVGCYPSASDAARALEAQARWMRDGVLSPPAGNSKEVWLEALDLAAQELRVRN